MTDTYDTASSRASYGIGRQMGAQLAQQAFEGLAPEAVAAGLMDTLRGEPSKVSEEDLHQAFDEIEKQIHAKAEEAGAEQAKAGEAFLQKNAKKDAVTVMDSGLQYEVVKEGDGEKPQNTSTVRVHYHGTLVNGDVFDSSVQRGQPAEFPVNGVIAGWTEALQEMKVGSKWRLFVPSHLAYGERGAGGKIGPNTTLIFDVELLDIVS